MMFRTSTTKEYPGMFHLVHTTDNNHTDALLQTQHHKLTKLLVKAMLDATFNSTEKQPTQPNNEHTLKFVRKIRKQACNNK